MPRRIYAVVSDKTFEGVLARVREDKQTTCTTWDMAHALAALAKAYAEGLITRASLISVSRAYDDVQDESDQATGRAPHLRDVERN